ncbi:MAG: phosphatase PAP2 family protein [Bacteroidota bacterium]|nr:phosphatase PAP2 family protein [Bacteroidota bacterium]
MKKFHKIISLVFQPLLIPTYAMILLMNMDVFLLLPLVWRCVAVIGTFIFTGVLPAVPIWLMIKRGEVHDLFISRREERTMPYLFSFLAYVFWALFMWRTLQLPTFIVAMGMGSAVSIFIIVFINMKWKISAHAAGMGGLCAAVFGVCYRTAINPVWLFVVVLVISALVALSRLELRAHTPGQVLSGFVVGFVTVFTPGLFF